MPSPINPIDHPICFSVPERRVHSYWTEHIPFAMWLTSALRPNILVELGTFSGTSYCAFCQAIAALDLPTRAFAVDTWRGDPHNGPNGHEVLDELKRHHDLRYSRFSTLLQMTFDDAVSHFADGEIDLLHIDGYHTYEAVRHDFETWRPKVSDRGIVLFHDIEERQADFGVWRLWDELRTAFPSFTFQHEHGLGVLAVGTDLPEEVRALLAVQDRQIEPVRKLFHAMGRRLRLETEIEAGLAERDAAHAGWDSERVQGDTFRAELEASRAECEAACTERDAAHAERDAAFAERDGLRAELKASRAERDSLRIDQQAIRADRDQIACSLRAADEQLEALRRERDEWLASQTWRTVRQLSLTAARIGPEGSRRRRMLKRLARLVEEVGRDGAFGFARRQLRQAIQSSGRHRQRGATAEGPAGSDPAAPGVPSGGTPHSHKGNSHARVH